MIRLVALLSVGMTFAAPGVLGGGAGLAAQETLDSRLVAAFPDAGTRGLLAQEVAAALEAGLPVEPLVQKALEGRSKGAADGPVVDAVRGLRERLVIASGILGEDAGETELVAAAGALYLGVDREALTRVIEETPLEAVPMALVVLGDLVKRGVAIALAQDVLLSLGQARVDANALAEFREQVEADIRTGVTPSRAAEVRSRGMVLSLGGGRRPPGGMGP